MAFETYYFFFSIIAVLVACLYITNAAYYRSKGKTLIGNSYKPGTIEYEKLRNFSNNRNLVIGGIVIVLCTANLIFDVYRLLHVPNQEYAHAMLTFAPLSLVILGIIIVIRMYSRFGKGKYKKESNKHNKDDGSWMS